MISTPTRTQSHTSPTKASNQKQLKREGAKTCSGIKKIVFNPDILDDDGFRAITYSPEPRRKGDECRYQLCEMFKGGLVYELCPDKLYLVVLVKETCDTQCTDELINRPDHPFILWPFQETTLMSYDPFSLDFGPYNLAAGHLFCSKLKIWRDTMHLRNNKKHIAIIVDQFDNHLNMNVTAASSIAALVLFNRTSQQVKDALEVPYLHQSGSYPDDIINDNFDRCFSDVSGALLEGNISLYACVDAFSKAMFSNFYNYYTFDHASYLYYESVISGDLNWIVPGKVLAFAGPSDKTSTSRLNYRHPPKFYHQYFRDHNVTDIIRLNDAEYEESGFIDSGFQHHDLIFPDGHKPPTKIANQFIKTVDSAKGAVAIHCFAGIGRTGTLIAAYLVARYGFKPLEAIAWTRICRPGSVIGEQQEWLSRHYENYQPTLNNNSASKTHKLNKPRQKKTAKLMSENTPQDPKYHDACETLETQVVASSATPPGTPFKKQSRTRTVEYKSNKSIDVEGPETSYTLAERALGQAKALVMAKATRRKILSPEQQAGPVTRNAKLSRLSAEGNTSADNHNKSSTSSRSSLACDLHQDHKDIVLDLGRTIPVMYYLSDLLEAEGNNKMPPATYRIKDGEYTWKVKFPEQGYVSIRLKPVRELRMLERCGTPLDDLVVMEPNLEFGLVDDEHDAERKRPVLYLHSFLRAD